MLQTLRPIVNLSSQRVSTKDKTLSFEVVQNTLPYQFLTPFLPKSTRVVFRPCRMFMSNFSRELFHYPTPSVSNSSSLIIHFTGTIKFLYRPYRILSHGRVSLTHHDHNVVSGPPDFFHHVKDEFVTISRLMMAVIYQIPRASFHFSIRMLLIGSHSFPKDPTL